MSAVIAAAAIDGMTDCAAAFMPSTPQWIACEGLGRTWDLPGIGGAAASITISAQTEDALSALFAPGAASGLRYPENHLVRLGI